MALDSSRTPRRGRKPKDPQVILDGLEALLAERAFYELNVEDILSAADVSRGTFYTYFATKQAAAATLFDQVLGEIAGTMSAFVERSDETPVMNALRTGIDDSTEVWFRHRRILHTIVDNAHAVPEFAEPVNRIKRQFAEAIAAEIERQRAGGLAPPGPGDTLELSTALVECTLHLLHCSSLDDARLPGPPRIGDIIMTLWCGTVYRTLPPAT